MEERNVLEVDGGFSSFISLDVENSLDLFRRGEQNLTEIINEHLSHKVVTDVVIFPDFDLQNHVPLMGVASDWSRRRLAERLSRSGSVMRMSTVWFHLVSPSSFSGFFFFESNSP